MYSIKPYKRRRAIYDDEELVCVTLYYKGAAEVLRRLQAPGIMQQWQDHHGPAEADSGRDTDAAP